MNANEQLMIKFYTAFQKLDYKTMQTCYHDDAVFNDPVFGLMDADALRAMWEMLCKNAKDFSLQFSDVVSEDEYGSCKWNATYIFSKTGRKVENKIKAYMKFADGKIMEHSDAFAIYRWNQQAFGLKGWLLGWTTFFQKRLRKQARKNLEAFMQKNNL